MFRPLFETSVLSDNFLSLGSFFLTFSRAVSAGTGEWLTREQHEEVSVNNEPPEYDFAVRVNVDSITSLFSDGKSFT